MSYQYGLRLKDCYLFYLVKIGLKFLNKKVSVKSSLNSIKNNCKISVPTTI